MSDQWYAARQGPNGPKKFGPVSIAHLKQAAAAGKLKPDDLLCQEGMAEWIPASAVVQFQASDLPTLPPVPVKQASQLPVSFSAYTDTHAIVPIPEQPQQPMVVISAPQHRSESSSLTKGLLIGGGVMGVVLLGFCGLAGILMVAGSSNQNQAAPSAIARGPVQPQAAPKRTGTITFAEHVDPETFRTVNEGRVFSQGNVHLLVQSNQSFNDSKLIVTYRLVGTSTWKVLGEYTVDPNWHKYRTVIVLTAPGGCRIKATNSKGEIIAEDEVQITGF